MGKAECSCFLLLALLAGSTGKVTAKTKGSSPAFAKGRENRPKAEELFLVATVSRGVESNDKFQLVFTRCDLLYSRCQLARKCREVLSS